jgi:hypothetical protein
MKFLFLVPTFVFTVSCASTPQFSDRLNNKQAEIAAHQSANGFTCEKSGESFEGSLIEWECYFENLKLFNGDSKDRRLLEQFSARSSGSPHIFALSQTVSQQIIHYFPLSGCLAISSKEQIRVYERNGKKNVFPTWDDFTTKKPSLCPILAPNIEYTPQGFYTFSKTNKLN